MYCSEAESFSEIWSKLNFGPKRFLINFILHQTKRSIAQILLRTLEKPIHFVNNLVLYFHFTAVCINDKSSKNQVPEEIWTRWNAGQGKLFPTRSKFSPPLKRFKVIRRSKFSPPLKRFWFAKLNWKIAEILWLDVVIVWKL